MAKTKFTDAAGREAWVDSSGRVYTEGGNRDTYYNVSDWNTRQSKKYSGGGSSSSSKSSSSKSSSGINYNDIVKESLKMYQKANEPAINTLKGSISGIIDSYGNYRSSLENQKEPLNTRYDNLIASIKGNQQQAENKQTLSTRNELGRRGLLPDSGLAEQEMVNAVNPITQQYTGILADTEAGRSADLGELATQVASSYVNQNAAQTAINNAIAQLQAGGASSGITTGLSTYLNQLQSQQAQRNWEQTTLPYTQAQIANLNRTSNQPTLAAFLEAVKNAGVGGNTTTPINQYPINAPAYSPTSGEGSYSDDKQWQYRNGQWYPTYFSPLS